MASLGTRRGEFWAGARGIFPLIVGAIPFGIIFGAAAVTSGLSPGAAAAMSAFVFAGSAQFVAVSMAGGGAGAWLIILTVLVINLRHVLYAATLAPYLRGLPYRWLVPLGFTLTDESFLVAVRRYQSPDPSPFKHWYYLGAASMMYVNWQLCTYIGLWAGLVLPNPRAWGLDFAFPLTFLGM
ncbi:MAG TPA: AzlC family ABC transporter permease, partial [Caldilineaceae bacterium]|nr:AzlC family ABC transporter permease [Caldilineaceae bacterium]